MDTLKHIFASVLGLADSAVTDELSPENTDTWDSLNAIVLLTEIERAFSISFSYDEAMSIKNFGEAVTLVRSKGIAL